MKELLDKAGHFDVVVDNAPEQGSSQAARDAWHPKFTDYGCVVLDYNGDMWPSNVKQAFVDYIHGGGGAVVIHAANNSFTGWKEFEQMVGLLWRDPKYGDSLYVDDDGKVVRVAPGEGRGMGHGGQYDWVMTTRDLDHPITKGMPLHWMHRRTSCITVNAVRQRTCISCSPPFPIRHRARGAQARTNRSSGGFPMAKVEW